MKTSLLATLIGTVLALSTAVPVAIVSLNDGGGFLADDNAAGADEHALHGGMAGDEHHAQIGMDRPSFPTAIGSVPTAAQAENMEQLSFADIRADSEFNPSNGVRSGTGTPEDPYIISGYYFTGELYIADTDACFIVKENYINGQLSLNWNGQCTHVHHNYIRDLRVNENNMRTGYATGGLLELNKIQYVGQLRHYDGEFRDNVVGPFTSEDIFDEVLETVPFFSTVDPRVANVDGFNQGLIHHNTFYGAVDLDLHGHHHGTGFFSPHSHYHGSNMTLKENHYEDHTDRWTSVSFTDNKIVDHEYYGLRYDDQNHRGDDRTANSEDEMMLEEPHIHHTNVEISRNVVEGAQIYIDIFNADDDLHYTRNPGALLVMDNTVILEERDSDDLFGFTFLSQEVPLMSSAIIIEVAKEVETFISGNTLEWKPLPDSSNSDPLGDLLPFFSPYGEDIPTAITLRGIRDSNITVTGNTAKGFEYGIAGYQMDEKANWRVVGNDFGAAKMPIFYDDSVINKPVTE